MIYVFIILLIVFCIYETYSLVMSILNKRKKDKDFENSLKAAREQGLADGSLIEKDGKIYLVDKEENSQEILEEGEKQD